MVLYRPGRSRGDDRRGGGQGANLPPERHRDASAAESMPSPDEYAHTLPRALYPVQHRRRWKQRIAELLAREKDWSSCFGLVCGCAEIISVGRGATIGLRGAVLPGCVTLSRGSDAIVFRAGDGGGSILRSSTG